MREVRKARKLTISQVAKQAGVSGGLISQIENGRTIPSLPVFLGIVKSLGGNSGDDFRFLLEGLLDNNHHGSFLHLKGKQFRKTRRGPGRQALYQQLFREEVSLWGIEITLLTLEAGKMTNPMAADALVFAYLIEGQFLMQTSMQQAEVKPGEALTFNGQLPHVTEVKEAPAVILFFQMKANLR